MYYFQISNPQKLTSYQLRKMAERFLSLNTIDELATLFETNSVVLGDLAGKPAYHLFHLPKQSGGHRLIETAEPELKKMHRDLGKYLQAVYFTYRPDCAYGCLLSPADEAIPRSIYTNAKQHLGKKWLFNIDLKDYFPSISSSQIFQLFTDAPFGFEEDLAQLLTSLTTIEDRLPQGFGTSPILSNMVSLELDKKILQLARKNNWIYTRFLDDLTISSKVQFKNKRIKQLLEIIEEEGFVIHPEKTAKQRIQDEPIVTGLVLKEKKPDVSKRFLSDLRGDIVLFNQLIRRSSSPYQIFPARTLETFRKNLFGRLNFLKFIRGEDHRSYLKLRTKLLVEI